MYVFLLPRWPVMSTHCFLPHFRTRSQKKVARYQIHAGMQICMIPWTELLTIHTLCYYTHNTQNNIRSRHLCICRFITKRKLQWFASVNKCYILYICTLYQYTVGSSYPQAVLSSKPNHTDNEPLFQYIPGIQLSINVKLCIRIIGIPQ